MTKKELQDKIDTLKKDEARFQERTSFHKEFMDVYQDKLDDTTLELSKLELQLARIEEQEDDIDYDDNSTDQEADDSITHSASEPR